MFELLLRSLWTFISTFVVLCMLLVAFVVMLIEFEAVIQWVKQALIVIAAVLSIAFICGVVLGVREIRKTWNAPPESSTDSQSSYTSARHETESEKRSDSSANLTCEHEDQESIDQMLDEFRRDFPEIDFGDSSDYAVESRSTTSQSSTETVIVQNDCQEIDGKPGKKNRKVTITIEEQGDPGQD